MTVQPADDVIADVGPEGPPEYSQPVVLVDDDHLQRISAAQTLELAGFEVEAFADPQLAVQRIERDFSGVVITDMRMPGLGGMEVLAEVRAKDPDLPVILMTGYGDIPQAVDAMRKGAYDFLEKPFRPDRLVEIVTRAWEKRALVIENRHLHQALKVAKSSTSFLVGISPQIERLRNFIQEIAAVPVDILVRGEPGIEAEQVARAIHAASPSRDGPFVGVLCAGLTEGQASLELFGSVRSGRSASAGRVAQSAGGVLYLEDVDQLPDPVRHRVEGASRDGSLKARLVMSQIGRHSGQSDDPVESLAGIGGTISWAVVEVPPVRLRGQDRIHLFQHFLDNAVIRFAVDPPHLSEAETREILLCDWPGNLPEIKAQAERFALGMGLTISRSKAPQPTGEALPDRVSAFERILIDQELRRNDGSIKATYMALGIPRKTLQDKMKKYGLKRTEYSAQG